MSNVTEWPPVIDFKARRFQGEAEARTLRLLEGLCLKALDIRNRIICVLSAEDGEWSSMGLVNYAKRYHMLMEEANMIARDCFAAEDYEWIVFAMFSKLADETKEAKILPWAV